MSDDIFNVCFSNLKEKPNLCVKMNTSYTCRYN